MAIPFAYSFRNLLTRKLTTFLTASGMTLVVFVFASILMLAAGLRQTLVSTGSPDNIVVIRKGSPAEVQSWIERSQASLLETLPQIATGVRGQKLIAKEIIVLISLTKRVGGQASNVTIRGIGENSLILRNQVKLVEGLLPEMGSSEIMAGRNVAKKFKGGGLGETLRFGMRDWTIVGIFDAGNTGFNSEIWGDSDQLMQAFRRPVYSSVIFKLNKISDYTRVKTFVETDPRLMLDAKSEIAYYEEQSEMMTMFLRILALTLTVIFSMGATIGAMITMYAAVANRTAEIGTLRAIGFQSRSILLAFLIESLILSLIGGCAGLILASCMQFITVSTLNIQTFSELAFSFRMTPQIVSQSLMFSLLMGLIGGMLPAIRAARLKIVDALRAV